MSLLRQIKNEIDQGIILKWRFFLVIIFISVVLTSIFQVNYNRLIAIGSISGRISFGDAIYYMFRGMKEYDISLNKAFDIADSFLIWNLLLAFMIGNYPINNLRSTGINSLIRAGKRSQWWLSKCVWNVVTVGLFYICIFIGMFIGTLVCSIFIENITCTSITFNPQLYKRVFFADLQIQREKYILIKTILLPLAASLSISMLQMAIALIVNPIVGYITVIVTCGISAYYMNEFLIGNQMMVYRYCEVNSNGIGIYIPLLFSLIIFIVSVEIGYLNFNTKDIL